MSFEDYSANRLPLINEYLRDSLSHYRNTSSQRFCLLIDAMEYSLGAGGKRLRPLIVLATAESLGLKPEDALPLATAIEYIHTYSLIHDDLPALDDDDMRRGRPSNHKKFGEAIAILAGDALLTEAFAQASQISTKGKFPAAAAVSAIELLAYNAGVRGMVGGQMLDVSIDTETFGPPEIEFIHIHKTGAMIVTSVLLPTKLVQLDEKKIQKLRRYGELLGLAFQISDDLLDAGTEFRYSRGPRKKPKPSYAKIMTLSEMREKLNRLSDAAIETIQSVSDKCEPLIDIANFVRTRKN